MEASSQTQVKIALLGAAAFGVGLVALRRIRRSRPQAVVTQLVVFPVKSCRGMHVEKVALDEGGFVHDRNWMIVRAPSSGVGESTSRDNAAGDVAPTDLAEMLTIRDLPRMATIQPSFTADGLLMLSTDNGKSIVVPNPKEAIPRKTLVWRSNVTGVDQGDEVAKFLTDFLECHAKPVRLIRMSKAERRLDACYKYAPAAKHTADGGGVSRFSDWTQLSIISNQTYEWLNDQPSVNEGVGNLRFRMNIVVDTDKAFAEDSWQTYSIGNVDCEFLKRCGRCQVPIVSAATGLRDKKLEPLKTLLNLRGGYYPFLLPRLEEDRQAFLGVNLRHFYQPNQTLRLGDKVVVSRYNGSWF